MSGFTLRKMAPTDGAARKKLQKSILAKLRKEAEKKIKNSELLKPKRSHHGTRG